MQWKGAGQIRDLPCGGRKMLFLFCPESFLIQSPTLSMWCLTILASPLELESCVIHLGREE